MCDLPRPLSVRYVETMTVATYIFFYSEHVMLVAVMQQRPRKEDSTPVEVAVQVVLYIKWFLQKLRRPQTRQISPPLSWRLIKYLNNSILGPLVFASKQALIVQAIPFICLKSL